VPSNRGRGAPPPNRSGTAAVFAESTPPKPLSIRSPLLTPSKSKEVHAQTFTTKIVDEHPTTVAGFEAYDATIELANVDELKLDPASRSSKLRVVFVRTPYTRKLFATKGAVPQLLILGYSVAPRDFDASLPDFNRFVASISLGPQQAQP
jgi:hypothetical protein